MDLNIDRKKSYLQKGEVNNDNKNLSKKEEELSNGKFLFSNGKVVEQKDLGQNINFDYSVLKRYDSDNNSVFDDSEIEQIKKDLADRKLSEAEEVSLYASVTGLSIEKSKEELQTAQPHNDNTSKEKDVRKTVLNRFSVDIDNGFAIYKKSLEDAGIISKGWNDIKDFLNSEYAGKNVVKELYKQQISWEILMLANEYNSMPIEKYIRTKINLLETLLKSSKLTDEECSKVYQAVQTMNLKEFSETIEAFVVADNDNDVKSLVDKVYQQGIKNMNFTAREKNTEVGVISIEHTPRQGSIEDILLSDKKDNLSFDQIYELERGVKYNPEKIMQYEQAENTANLFLMINNYIVEINNALEEPSKQLEMLNSVSGTQQQLESAYTNLSRAIMGVLSRLYGDDSEAKNIALKKFGGDLATIKDGKLDFGAVGINYNSIVKMARNIQDELKQNLSKMLGEKTLEQIQEDLQKDYTLAFGKSAAEIGEKFQQNQQEGVGYAKIGTTAVGLVTAVASGGVFIPLLGVAISTVGSPFISYEEAKTKAEGLTKEDKAEIKKELMTSGLFTAASFGIGAVSGSIYNVLAQKCPTLVASFARYGSDAVMITLLDYSVTGEVNLTSTTVMELMNILTAVVAHRKITTPKGGKASGVEESPKGVPSKAGKKSESENVKVPKAKETDLGDGRKHFDFSEFTLAEDIMSSNPYNELRSGRMEKQVSYLMNYDRLPEVVFPGGYVLDLNNPEYIKMFSHLSEGEQLIIGREGHIKINDPSKKVSRSHLIVYKQGGQLRIVDISANGTKIHLDASSKKASNLSSGKMQSNEPYLINGNSLPKLLLAGRDALDLSQYSQTINSLTEGQYLTVGRDPACNIRITEGHISNQHLIIYKSGGKLKIKDISRNGTEVIKPSVLDRINSYVDKLFGLNLSTKEQKLIGLFADNPKVQSILNEPRKLKSFVKNLDKILKNPKQVSSEVRTALEHGMADLGSGCGAQKCSIDKNLMNDIVKLAMGEDYIGHFNSNVSFQSIMAQTPVGEVVNWGGQLFVNNGEFLQRINLSEKTFRKLFPPISRFNMHQGNIGTCYLVSGLEKMYSSPKGRAMLYNLIGEDSSGIYTLTYNSNGVKTYFRRFDSHYKHVREENGLAILEQGYCKNTAKAAKVFNPRETLIMDLNNGGRVEWALEGLIGRKPNIICGEEAKANQIRLHANNPNAIINCGTLSYRGSDRDILCAKYNILANHEYSIKGYNPINDSVIICNPHHSGLTVEIPMNEFLQYFNEISILIL